MATAVAACAIQPTDVSPIKFGATRATVEGVLGKPVKSVQTDTGRIDTYKYNRGYTPTGGSGGSGDGCAPFITVCIGVLAIAAVVAPIAHGIRYERQRGDIDIIYGPDDTVLWLERFPGKIEEVRKILARAEQGDAEATFRLALLSSSADERRKWISLAANQGHAEAQFQLYTRDKPDGKSLTWLCLAANQGHALAQEELGDLHVKGLGQAWREAGLVELDPVRAYVWYSLAAANGDRRAGYIRDDLADQMTPEQIAEGERLAAEWKPGDCGTEGSPTKSAG